MLNAIINKIKFLNFIVNHPLNEFQKWNALRRYVCWQVGSRLVPGDVVVSFVNKTCLRVAPGMTGATCNIYAGLHEFEDMAFVLHLLRQDNCFVDVGANIGSYTILAGATDAKCISIEPIKKTFSFLEENVNLNNFSDQVKLLNLGIGKNKGVLRFTGELDTVNHVLSHGEGASGSIEVPVVSLNELLLEEKPVLIKIDVEGFESEVIAGATEVLSSTTLLAVIMELNGSGERYGFDELALHKKMLSYGFKSFVYSPFDRELVSLNERKSNSGNTLYIRNIDEVNMRLKSAKRYWIANVKKYI